ncbi:MAG: acyl-CoA dehydrogenase family protein [Leptospiraceae bacterium]|nr:acyl-CoA dehydrogenase family protein [Leptospiraceae bacterium]
MIKSNYFTTNEDMQYHFETLIDWEEIVNEYEDSFSHPDSNSPSSVSEAMDYYRTVIETAGDISGNYFSQAASEIDKEGLKFKDGKVSFPKLMLETVAKGIESGIQPYAIHRKYGGLGIPFVARAMMTELIYRGDSSMGIAFGCLNLAEILERIASEEMKAEWLPRLASGEFVVAMGLTEPNHGSDLQQVKTRATKQSDGTWKINGTKRFITHACGFGDTPSILLTLARTGGENSGGRGLSFFLVHGKDIQVAGIEKKMGLHCSPTCEVVFENTPGILIGEEGFGLVKYTMGMLNGARIGVAGQGTGMATAALEEAKKYANERTQFGRKLSEIPAIQKMLARMERETMALRAISIEGSRTVDLYYWRTEHLKAKGATEKEIRADESSRFWEKVANLFTPLCKYYCSETANKIAYDAIQIHGGSGFTEDYDIARIYRDARITTIYDGTTQIQINAAIGGIATGFGKSGVLKDYIQLEMKKFTPSERLLTLYDILERTIATYRDLEMGALKDEFAFELAESTIRFLASMLLEKSIAKPNLTKNRELHVSDFSLDSLAIMNGNLMKLQEKTKYSNQVAMAV